MSGDRNLDQDDAQHIEIEDVLDNLPWENEQQVEIGTTYHGKTKLLKVKTVNIPMQNGAAGLFKVFISRRFLEKMKKMDKPVPERRWNA